MTNYFKIYLGSKNEITKKIAKNKAEVMKILMQAQKDGFISYTIVKRIKPSTDIPIGYGTFSKEYNIEFLKNLETDWRINGAKVIDWDKYKQKKQENLYNLLYKVGDKTIQKKNMTKEEIDKFINNLEKEYDSELKITKVIKNEEKEER